MAKANQNFIMFKGDDGLPIDFLHVGPFYQQTGQLLEIDASDTAEWRMFDEGDEPNPHVLKTHVSGITYHQSPNGTFDDMFRVTLDEADTSGLAVDKYQHQLRVFYGGTGVGKVIGAGEVNLQERATGEES